MVNPTTSNLTAQNLAAINQQYPQGGSMMGVMTGNIGGNQMPGGSAFTPNTGGMPQGGNANANTGGNANPNTGNAPQGNAQAGGMQQGNPNNVSGMQISDDGRRNGMNE
jgi:hypothetical protein